MRIIGCGNLDRGDDAAGILVAERLRDLGIEAQPLSGAAFDLIEEWRGADEVIVIDAMRSGAPPGTVRIWDDGRIPERLTASSSTHGLGVAEALCLARTLDLLPQKPRIIGIEGAEFGVGTPLSTQVQEAVEAVAQQITVVARLAATTGPRPVVQ